MLRSHSTRILLVGIGLFSLFGNSKVLYAGENAVDIIGGIDVSERDPDAVSTVGLLERSPEGVAMCTASILAPDILVTAAHCVTETLGNATDPSNVLIAFGNDLNGNAVDIHRVTGVMASPKWKGLASRGKDQGDIAVVRFSGGLPTGYRAAKLLPARTPLRARSSVVLMGYGVNQMNSQGGSGAGVLRKVDALIDSPTFGKTEVLLDQRNGKGACHGDSGGPAFIRDQNGSLLLWGVTNRADPEDAADCSEGSVYTRITAYSSFINDAVRKLRGTNTFINRLASLFGPSNEVRL